ncbi:3-dehydroquinate synthase [soil metagenome]
MVSAPDVRSVVAGSYVVRIGAGLRHGFAGEIVAAAPAHRYAVVTDVNVARHYADALVTALSEHGAVSLHVIPSGEKFKTRSIWARVTDELLAAGCGRDTTVVALGGGVVGDLAGFVAATFMRGVPVVQCPTTLLAMIDASVGGKTGVDTDAGKNLVGVFHPPSAVLADVEVIATLPAAHRRAGLAEAFKHGIICDSAYLASLEASSAAIMSGHAEATLDAVVRSVEIKAEIVRDDPREMGRRKTLNFGHTIGHGVELASGFELLHGECVAIGMVLEARLAEQLGVAEKGTAEAIEGGLRGAAMPTAIPRSVDVDAVIAATHRDKKARAGAVEYALPLRVGEMADNGMTWSFPVPDAAVRRMLA